MVKKHGVEIIFIREEYWIHLYIIICFSFKNIDIIFKQLFLFWEVVDI